MLIDSHTHPQFPAYDADRDQVIRRAQETGIKMIVVGTNVATSLSAIRLAEQYPNDVWASIGFHPSHVTTEAWHHDKNEQAAPEPEQFDIKKLRELAQHQKVVAIGECGMDYYRLGANRESQIAQQKEVFLAQAELARELKKPLMIHCRPSSAPTPPKQPFRLRRPGKTTEGEPRKGTDDAYKDLLQIAKRIVQIAKIVHFYVGSPAVTEKLLHAGFYFTFGGVITFPPKAGGFAGDYDESIRMIPLERILLETDAPYVAPAPYRGKRNEPAYVIEVAKKLAELRNVSPETVAAVTTKTAQHLFGINPSLL